jgi:serpin B
MCAAGTAPGSAAEAAFRATLRADLGSATGAAALLAACASDDPAAKLVVANSLWSRRAISPSFAALARGRYAARAEPLTTAAPVNAWVSTATDGLITHLVDDGVCADPSTEALLINAAYFKAAWTTPFKPESTRADVFHAHGGGDALPCMMMAARLKTAHVAQGEGFTVRATRRRGAARASHTRGARRALFCADTPRARTYATQALSLPYGAGRFRALLLLPSDASPASLAALCAAPASWSGPSLERAWRTADVALSLPRFKVTAPSAPFKGIMIAMGLGAAFNPSEGAFEPMGSRELYLAEVFHAGVLEVNEAGTEAAAATAAVMMTRGMPARPLELRFDRPFLFVVEDTRAGGGAEGSAEGGGAPVFIARVTRPELTGVTPGDAAAAAASPEAGGGTPPPPPWAVAAAAAGTPVPPSPVPFGAAPSVSTWLPQAPAAPRPPAAASPAALHAADLLSPLRGAISALRRTDAHVNACAALACRLARKQAVVADWARADATAGAGAAAAAHDAARAPRLALLSETLRDARRVASLCAAARARGGCRAAAEAARLDEVSALLAGCHERLSRHPPARPRHPHPEQDRLLKRLAAAAAGSDSAGLAAAAHADALALLASLRADAMASTRALLAAAPQGPYVARAADANSRDAAALAALGAATSAHATQARALADSGATHAAALVARLAVIASSTSPFAPRRARPLTAAAADAQAEPSTRIEDVLLLHAAAVAHVEALPNSEAVLPMRASMAAAHAALAAAVAQTDTELRAALEVTARDGGAAAAAAGELLAAAPHVAALHARAALRRPRRLRATRWRCAPMCGAWAASWRRRWRDWHPAPATRTRMSRRRCSC